MGMSGTMRRGLVALFVSHAVCGPSPIPSVQPNPPSVQAAQLDPHRRPRGDRS